MKQKILNSLAGVALCMCLIIGFSSFVDNSEDDEARKRHPEISACLYHCWYKDSQGNWYSVPKTGLETLCPRVEYQSNCSPLMCYPETGC